MTRMRWRGLLLLLALVMTACGSTQPATDRTVPRQTSVADESVTAAPSATADATAAATPAPAVTTSPTSTEEADAASSTASVTPIMRKLELTGEPYATLGDPHAPMTVIEFSDYGCPFCRRYTMLTWAKLKHDYIDTGRVFYVFKDYPIVQLHPQADLAAEAAECVGRQGAYWKMHELLFANQSSWDTTSDVARTSFDKYVVQLKLDQKAYDSCMSQGQTQANVARNIAEGQHLGINGTPSFVINGKLLSGAQPTETFQRIFDRELKALGATPAGVNP